MKVVDLENSAVEWNTSGTRVMENQCLAEYRATMAFGRGNSSRRSAEWPVGKVGVSRAVFEC